MEKAWVSFCISTYKRPEFLKKQIASLLEQSFQYFEIVISDNDPDGSGKDVVSSFNDDRVKYYQNGENLGMVKSFNKSIERASTDYIVMITDDDPVKPNMLENFFQIVNKHPGFGIYFGCERKGRQAEEIEICDGKNFVYQILHPELTTNILWSSCVLKREVAISIGGMPDYGSPHLADHAMLALCGKANGGVIVNMMYSELTMHDNNFSKANFNLYYLGCIGFHKLITSSFDKNFYVKGSSDSLKKHLDNWFISNSFGLRKYFTYKKKDTNLVRDIDTFSKKMLNLSFMKHLSVKYYLKLLIFNLKKPFYLLKFLR